MKSIAAALLTNYSSDAPTVVWGVKITRTDATVYGWTTGVADATISGVTYRASPGLDVASVVSSSGFATDNTELTLIADGTTVTRADLLSGRWDAATVELFRYNWASPSDGRDVVKRGRLGNWTPKAGAWVAELRGLRQALQQPVGSVVQPVCRYRLGDSDCGVNLGPLTHAGTVTAVASLSQFTAGAFGQAEGACSNGVLTWSTGTNAGLQCKIRTQTVAGVITLSLPLVQAIQIGDTFSAIEGCSGRLLEDCRDRFDNVLNFGGEPHLPGQDQLSSPP